MMSQHIVHNCCCQRLNQILRTSLLCYSGRENIKIVFIMFLLLYCAIAFVCNKLKVDDIAAAALSAFVLLVLEDKEYWRTSLLC